MAAARRHLPLVALVTAVVVILSTEFCGATPLDRYSPYREQYEPEVRRNVLVDTYTVPTSAQESVYSRRRPLGLSASTIIFIVLSILGVGFALWCCKVICYPYYMDQRSDSYHLRNSSDSVRLSKGLEMETSTATPSP